MLFHVGAILRLNEFGMLAGKKEAEIRNRYPLYLSHQLSGAASAVIRALECTSATPPSGWFALNLATEAAWSEFRNAPSPTPD